MSCAESIKYRPNRSREIVARDSLCWISDWIWFVDVFATHFSDVIARTSFRVDFRICNSNQYLCHCVLYWKSHLTNYIDVKKSGFVLFNTGSPFVGTDSSVWLINRTVRLKTVVNIFIFVLFYRTYAIPELNPWKNVLTWSRGERDRRQANDLSPWPDHANLNC